MRLVFLSLSFLLSGFAVGVAPAVTDAEFRELLAKVSELTARVQKLEAATQAAPATTQTVKPDDKIAKAIAERRLAVGMTVEQANKALGVTGEMKSEAGNAAMYEWVVRYIGVPRSERTIPPSASSGRFVSGEGAARRSQTPEAPPMPVKPGRYSAEVRDGKIVEYFNP